MTMTKFKLTDKETKALRAAVEVNTTVEDAHEDDFFSYFYPSEIVAATDLTKEQVAGLLGALGAKGLVEEQDSQNKRISKTEWAVRWAGIEILRAT
jgi:DNA-binding MarR family transcriptional regulator